jgi:hypothetical protein
MTKKRDNKIINYLKTWIILTIICVSYLSFKMSKDNLVAENFLICVSDNYPTLMDKLSGILIIFQWDIEKYRQKYLLNV